MQKRSLALRGSSSRRQERHYSVEDVNRILNKTVLENDFGGIQQILKVLDSVSIPIRQLSDLVWFGR